MSWSEPKDIKEWAYRTFAFRPFLLILLTLGICITEMRFDWMETVLGAYLTTTNSHRPESGTIWEEDHQAGQARSELEQIVTNRQTIQNDIRKAASLSEILEQIPESQGVMISTEHFRQLYFDLPRIVAEEIISPFSLLKIASEGHWDRVYFDMSDADLNIYMLDRNNQVLHQVSVVPDLLYHIERGEAAFDGTLDNLADFSGRIYDAGLFFGTLATMGPELRNRIIPRPAGLLDIDGRIIRVGISDRTAGDRVELGFEIETPEGYRVRFIQCGEWDAWRLRRHLDDAERAESEGEGLEFDFTEGLQ